MSSLYSCSESLGIHSRSPKLNQWQAHEVMRLEQHVFDIFVWESDAHVHRCLSARKEPKVNFGERMKTAALKVATWISHTTDLDMHAMLGLAGEVRTAEQLAESRGGRQHISHRMCPSGTRYDFHAGALHHCKEQLEGHGWSGQIWSPAPFRGEMSHNPSFNVFSYSFHAFTCLSSMRTTPSNRPLLFPFWLKSASLISTGSHMNGSCHVVFLSWGHFDWHLGNSRAIHYTIRFQFFNSGTSVSPMRRYGAFWRPRDFTEPWPSRRTEWPSCIFLKVSVVDDPLWHAWIIFESWPAQCE